MGWPRLAGPAEAFRTASLEALAGGDPKTGAAGPAPCRLHCGAPAAAEPRSLAPVIAGLALLEAAIAAAAARAR